MITYSMSPATDYAAMMLALYGITAWILAMENGEDVSAYALISVFMVYVLTIKVSAGCLVLLAIYPGIKLLSGRQYRKTGIYFMMGVIVLLPYLIRNYLISGWLIYPFAGIDLFQVDWKVPLAVLQRDAGQIEAYGKCLYKPELADTPIGQWIPVWWAGQRFDERMLIMVFGFGTIGILVHGGMELLHHKLNPQWLILIFAIGCSALLWFVQAPFIRYGLSFLLEMPLLLGGICIRGNRHGFKRILAGVSLIMILILFTPYLDNYLQDFGVFTGHHLKDGYYILQQDYDIVPDNTQYVGTYAMHYPDKGELNSYYAFPGTAYQGRLDEIEARGDTLRDGFRHK